MNYKVVTVGEDIYHYGIKGQKWGLRRYQNKDGSLTSAGKKRYSADGTVTEGDKVRQMTKEERERFSKIASTIESASGDPNDLADKIEYANTKLLDGARLTNMKFGYDSSTDLMKIKSFEIEGRRTAEQVLSKSQTKALNKAVRDQRKERGEQIAGILIGAPLAGLTYVYLKSLGMV